MSQGRNNQHIVVGIISMEIMLLNRLMHSIKLIDLEKIQMDFVIFLNHPNYVKPIYNLSQSNIKYLLLHNDSSLKIAEARNFLQQEIFNDCKKQQIDPIVWLLDEDIEIDNRVNEYIPLLSKFKKASYDVLIGSIDGDSPNASFSGMQVQLFDLIQNLKWLASLDGDEILPFREESNQKLRLKYPDYYYDLTSNSDKGHLNNPFWLIPLDNNETVNEARRRIYSNLDSILSGKNLFRPIKQEKVLAYKKSLLRGANTFILNLNTLRIKQPIIKIEKHTIRRSDMLWALANQEFFNHKIIKVDFTVLHKREEGIIKELSVDKTADELCGSIVFNSLKIFYERKQKISFENILYKQMDAKVNSVKVSFKKTKEYIDTLDALNKPELESFCQELYNFYTDKNLTTILNRIKVLSSYKNHIFESFISSKPMIMNECDLTTGDYGLFKQYDLGDDSIKMLSKKSIEGMDRSIPPLVRIHSSCCNSEVFHANDCDCASQLAKGMKMISNHGDGIIFYLNQEGRGHGYSKKIAIVKKMQKEGINTYESCKTLGLEDDIRDYTKVAEILKDFGFKKIRLLSNNPRKISDIESSGIEIVRTKLRGEYTYESIDYLASKENYAHHDNLIITEDKLIKKYPLSSKNRIEFYEKEDEYGGFSNFSDHPLVANNRYWRTSEHYYQSNKFEMYSEVYEEIQQAKTAMIAKEIAHSNKVLSAWESRKILFMYMALYKKFTQNYSLKQLLLSTDGSYIVERAKDDEFWGDGKNGDGKNMLGRLLMFVRDELKETEE